MTVCPTICLAASARKARFRSVVVCQRVQVGSMFETNHLETTGRDLLIRRHDHLSMEALRSVWPKCCILRFCLDLGEHGTVCGASTRVKGLPAASTANAVKGALWRGSPADDRVGSVGTSYYVSFEILVVRGSCRVIC